MPNVRIGIDVGGTFTHAVAVNSSNLKLVGQAKVKTTHTDKNGVAQGIVDSLKLLLKGSRISPKNISLIAHSTTQATNALLEGDVSPVGIIALGSKLQGYFVRRATDISDVKLPNGRSITTFYQFYDDHKGVSYNEIREIIFKLKFHGAKALVVAEAFSPEDSESEKRIAEVAAKLGISCTATSDISGLYGLRVRAKTAVINASILPKMIDAAEKTERAIRALKISAPIMVVRSDGGVLSLEEMKRRPILTILSGPAAGVGAALFHEKISDGIFVEVGGTSTDISVIRDGVSQIKPAVLGGNRIYLKTLDVKTIGVAGGSIPRISNKNIFDVGPRSAHIAGIDYSAFSTIKSSGKLNMKMIQPKQGDLSDYLSFSSGKNHYTLTPTCASNLLGYVRASDWAYGKINSVKRIFKQLQNSIGIKPEQAARTILDIATEKLEKVVCEFIKSYDLDICKVSLVGGGGGAASLVPYLAKRMKLRHRLSKNHAVISAIGAAMSMVHDEVERSVLSPTEEDLLKIKMEAEDNVVSMGALPSTVQVNVVVDKQRNIVKASAFGSLKMEKRRTKTLNIKELKEVMLKEGVEKQGLSLCGKSGKFSVFQAERSKSWLFLKRREKWVYVLSDDGRIVKSVKNAENKLCSLKAIKKNITSIVDSSKRYGDAGAILPKFTIVFPNRVADLTGVSDEGLMDAFIGSETKKHRKGDDKVAIIWKLM